MSLRASTSVLIGMTAIAFSATAWADFTPPKDGKFTEKQLTEFIAISKAQMDAIKAASNAGTSSGAAGIAIYEHASAKIDAAYAQNGMSKEEFNWMNEKVTQLWPIAAFQKQWQDNSKPDLEKQIKVRSDESTAAKSRLDRYKQAQKTGTRVLTTDQRDAAIASATSDRDSIAGEVKTDDDALKPINDEITQHDKDASDAEALAKTPPADVSADDRSGYIDQKKNEAQTAHDAGKDARDRLKEAQKNLDDAKARLAIANGKIAHPEIPVTDDEKNQVKSDNDQGAVDAKTAASNADQAIATLKETLAAGPVALATGTKKPDPDNLALVQKHIEDYLNAIGAGGMLKAK